MSGTGASTEGGLSGGTGGNGNGNATSDAGAGAGPGRAGMATVQASDRDSGAGAGPDWAATETVQANDTNARSSGLMVPPPFPAPDPSGARRGGRSPDCRRGGQAAL